VPEAALEDAVREVFDLTPAGIIKALDLRKPLYKPTAAYGHFGRQPGAAGHFSWEQTNRVEDLRLAVQRSAHYRSNKVSA
jgi:S-adenosylmethionine synthetase